jgi:hypothetical protein
MVFMVFLSFFVLNSPVEGHALQDINANCRACTGDQGDMGRNLR